MYLASPPEIDDSALHARELAATSPGGGFAVNIRTRAHGWTVDEPQSIGGQDTGPDPVTVALGGLLSCMIIAFKFTAKRRKLVIDQVRGSLAATPEGKVKEINLKLEVWSEAPEADVQKLLAPAKATCLVHDMFRHDLPINVELVVKATGAA